ncbi:MAG TPA: ComEA family DNA-binding protein [Propionibacteriaceae bacterium]|nr:ComEA family DNA-binding protein [Propionibacteriaceae bacterium]
MGRGRRELDVELSELVRARLAHVLPGRSWATEVAGSPNPPVQPVEPALPASPARPPGFGRAHLGVVVTLLLIGLLAAGWAVLRAKPVPLVTPVGSTAPPEVRRPSAGQPSGVASSTATPPPVVVHVLGAVRRPGVVSLTPHARVGDAIRAAGGLRADADPGQLNLAQILQDGQQVLIGKRQQPSGEVRGGAGSDGSGGASGSAASGGSSDSQTGPVLDLNAASKAELETLPGVGPVTAGKIVAWRQEHGRFTRLEELQEIDGIGPKTFAQLSQHLRL